MKQKTAMQLSIEALEQKKKILLEIDLMGFLLPNEYAHKQNEINSIQIMLSNYLPTEREQIEEAYNQGYRDGEIHGDKDNKTDVSTCSDASNYYQQKYENEK